MNQAKSKFGRRYDEDFKRQSVALIQTQQRSLRQLSREIGVSEWSLARWCKQYAPPAAAAAGDLQAEVARLRRELEVVSRQRDVLKKPWPSWGRSAGTLRSDCQEESQPWLRPLQQRRTVRGACGPPARLLRPSAKGARRAPPTARPTGRADQPAFPPKPPDVRLSPDRPRFAASARTLRHQAGLPLNAPAGAPSPPATPGSTPQPPEPSRRTDRPQPAGPLTGGARPA
jgi:transposase